MDTNTYLGGCLCGSIRYRAFGKARNRAYCHCTSCRRAVGSPMVPWATFDRDCFALEAGELALYASSPPVTRGFCRACGTSITYSHAGRAREIDVTLATLDDPTLVVPRAHIWVQDKLPWVVITDRLPQYDTVL